MSILCLAKQSARSGFKAYEVAGIRQSIRKMSSVVTYEHIITSTPRPGVGQITLNRPKAYNALSTPLMTELNNALRAFDSSKDVGSIVITGNEKAFAALGGIIAGADIKEMKDLDFSAAFGHDFIKSWSDLTSISIPIIAAVNGFALGGGCELAMMADILYCGPKATFGQPEIKLGVIPGAGGSQRLTAAIGKSRAMELILTGKNFTAIDAEKWGLAARVFDTPEACVNGALDTARTIAGYGRLAVKACKEVVNQSLETGLSEGVKYERRVFHSIFASQDQKIGMRAFVEKKDPQWSNS